MAVCTAVRWAPEVVPVCSFSGAGSGVAHADGEVMGRSPGTTGCVARGSCPPYARRRPSAARGDDPASLSDSRLSSATPPQRAFSFCASDRACVALGDRPATSVWPRGLRAA